MSIQEILESAGLPAQRGVYTGRDKPDAYYTFLRLLGTPAVNADDEEKERREMYRVTLFHKGDFEAQLDKTKEVLKAAGVYINSIDAESYETETMTLGLKDLYYAVCTEADGAESYGTPKKMAEAMSADLSVKTADGSLYADDTLSESVTEFASGTLKLGIKDLTPEVLAELLGQAVDKNSVVWAGKEDEPPYVAVGFRAKKTGGKYRYVWLLKAKFKVPSEKYETKGESIKFNTPDIEASFTTRKKDNLWKADFVGTEESAAAKTWFTAVPEKAAAMESV